MATILYAQNTDLYSGINVEPQYITSRSPNRAILYLDSQDNKLSLDKVDIHINSVNRLGDKPSNMAYGINRIGVESIGINYVTPNINERNNNIVFNSSVTNLNYSVFLREGFYKTPLEIITEIVFQMNTVTGSSGLNFSANVLYGNDSMYTLSVVGGNFYFILSCNAIQKGYQLYSLPEDQSYTSSKIIGNISGYYTRYIDFCSDTIVQYAKLKSGSTSSRNNIVNRIFIDDPTKPHVIGFSVQGGSKSNLSYSFPSTVPINTVHFKLLDQFGENLYIPKNLNGNCGFFWDCNLSIEI